MRYIPLAIVAALGLCLTTPTDAKAGYYTYGGYTYYTPVDYSLTTIRSYTRAESLDLYVSTWYDTTTSPYFTDSMGRTWRWSRPAVEIRRGYGFYGSYYTGGTRYYQRLCGTVRYCARTGLITLTCTCGDVYYLDY